MNYKTVLAWAIFFVFVCSSVVTAESGPEISEDTEATGFDWDTLSYRISGLRVEGYEANNDISMTEAQFGVALPLGFRVEKGADIHLTGFNGERAGQSVNTEGIGASFHLRWHYLSFPSWSSYIEYGAGFMLTTENFPPDGTWYNFLTSYGGGFDVHIRDNLHLLLGVRNVHLSNGKGMVRDNPTFEGFGGYIQLQVFSEAAQARAQQADNEYYVESGNFIAFIDGYMGTVDDEDYRAIELNFGLSLNDSFALQFVGVAGDLAEEQLNEFGGFFVYRPTDATLGIYYGRKEFADITSNIFSVGVQYYENTLVTIRGLLCYEENSLDDESLQGGFFLDVYLTDNLLIQSGLATDRFLEEPFKANDVDLTAGIDWQWGRLGDFSFSLFAEKWMTDVNIVGFRVMLTESHTLKETRRQGFFHRIR